MKKPFLIIIVFILFCFACQNNKTIISEQQTDAFFIETQDTTEDYAKYRAIRNDFFFTKNINDKIIFNIIDIEFGHTECFIKEYCKDEIKRFYQVYDDYVYYHSVTHYYNYTTSISDSDILEKNLTNYCNKTFEHLLSEEYWQIPELRKTLKNDRKPPNDIEKLEDLINNLEIFEDYEIDSEYHNKILKELLILTQISFLMYPAYDNLHNDNMQLVDIIFNTRGAKEIKDTTYIYKLEVPYLGCNKWEENNIKFLVTKLKTIQCDINKPNVFYFLTSSDFKLLRFEVSIIEGKIKLKKEYINEHFIQPDPIWFFKKNRHGLRC